MTSSPFRRQLLRLLGTLLCSPVLVRAAERSLPAAVRKRIVATLAAPLPSVLNVHHLALIRRFNIGWSPVESGAPMLNPAQPLGDSNGGDTLALAMQIIATKDAALAAQRLMEAAQLLPHFVQMANLKPGNYANGKTPFTFTTRHLTLLRQQSWMPLEMLGMGSAEDYLAEGYWPTPSVDGKRPYGNFTNYPVEMAQALNLPVRQQADGTLTITSNLEAEMEALHEQTEAALQVFVWQAGLMRNKV
ncbi:MULTISPECIES: hypothetical protein [unclassified Janthinobacterium]|uniref:hypothetical protein n=1 Tax=unclassified Janthinobacterium TaxID=2610881 RepID=UPI0016087BB9|nr:MULTISPECIES: hypothetical protein [unclassified Janthinobacterium]MBB5368460.1 hypothetical protein [Janthinobacterium sp. K2C7]MBB5382004.1 hypothetical protein [Janthinobacterium sp. K2Li3]MBB5386842.1 hypothetical protein [Janthinobacterium sp. K2E3]